MSDLSDQPPGVDDDDPDFRPDPADAARRVLEFVSWFGDGDVFGDPDRFPLHSRDLEVVARTVVSDTTVEWGVRRPTEHFGVVVETGMTEEQARRQVANLHDTERFLNACPEAELVRRTTFTTDWQRVEAETSTDTEYWTAARDNDGNIRLNRGRGYLVADAAATRDEVQSWLDNAAGALWRNRYRAALELFDREAAQ